MAIVIKLVIVGGGKAGGRDDEKKRTQYNKACEKISALIG